MILAWRTLESWMDIIAGKPGSFFRRWVSKLIAKQLLWVRKSIDTLDQDTVRTSSNFFISKRRNKNNFSLFQNLIFCSTYSNSGIVKSGVCLQLVRTGFLSNLAQR